MPLPNVENLDVGKEVREELLTLGAEYAWLDVLCLRQHSNIEHYLDYTERNRIQEEGLKTDVPTIGNIYRLATALVPYFNGLRIPFSTEHWDSPRHWLQPAWTLQEIKNENITINAKTSEIAATTRILINTRATAAAPALGGESPCDGKPEERAAPTYLTLRSALRPVLRIAAEVSSPNGCNIYALAKEMDRHYATQPTDKVSGLLYLLRTISCMQ